ncbi:MAG: hypothetical protein K6B44_07580 [Lachnospiraceae bacterium]|nr:hypothetical protein [Lachnospiraceae bacterium]
MREEDYKKRGKTILLIIAILLAGAALVVFVFDPFFHYHKPWFGLKPVQTRQQYQVNGALEHLDYDALLLGSSVTMNINSSLFDEAYGCSTVKAVASGGACSTFAYYLDKAYKYRELKYVFWGIDPDQLQYEPVEDPKQDQVEYLRDKNPFNDVNYLWNVDVIFKEIPYMVTMSMHKDFDTGRAYDFSLYSEYGYDKAIGMYQPEGEVEEMKSLTGENYLAKREKNIDLIEEQVAAHPETEYKFFFTVASILWWDIHYRDGGMERYFATFARLVERLEKYDNVSFYSGVFNDKDIIMDLSRYCDYCHADYEVNLLQAESVINEDRVINSENIAEETDVLRSIVYEFEDRLQDEGGNWDFLKEYEGCSN